MADVLKFRGKTPAKEICAQIIEMAEAARGQVTGALCIIVTNDDEVHVMIGPDLDAAMATLAKLQAIIGSVYTNNLAAQ